MGTWYPFFVYFRPSEVVKYNQVFLIFSRIPELLVSSSVLGKAESQIGKAEYQTTS